MDALTLPPALVAPAGIAQQGDAALEPWRGLVAQASLRFGVPADWILRVMRAESGGRLTLRGLPITSPKGAMGLMQVMPATYAALARRHGLGADPYLPRDNILAGTAYLREMYDRFGYPGLFAAYNAGPGRYAAYLRTGRGLPGETRAYLARVIGAGGERVVGARETTIAGGRSQPPAPRRDTLFFTLSHGSDPAQSASPAQSDNPLFVPLSRPGQPPR